MYAFIAGRVAEKGKGELVLEAGGVGYALQCSVNTLAAAPQVGETMRCYTFLSVREDALELFGFSTHEEKAMFLRLVGISGIGPRTALGVLGSMPLKDLHLAILTGDVNALSRAPGVGKKTAQRIALELKDQVSQEALTGLPQEQYSGVPVQGDAFTEALQALQSLGYTPVEASRALQAVRGKSDKADELIKLALRSMAGM
jgi:Holliday junction DNA helicase RuvA